MKLIKETLCKTNRTIIDADVSPQMTAVLVKEKGENIVTVNGNDAFSVSTDFYMIRILDDSLAIYDGKKISFFTVDGKCIQEVAVGEYLFDMIPMRSSVICTYRDQGVYGHQLGEQRIVVVAKDGNITSYQVFANRHQLDFDIRFARVKPYACLSTETNTIVQFTEDFTVQKTLPCPFNTADLISFSYHFPYYLFIENDKCIYFHINGTYEVINHSFSYNVRSNYHRGPVFLEILEREVMGYYFTEDEF